MSIGPDSSGIGKGIGQLRLTREENRQLFAIVFDDKARLIGRTDDRSWLYKASHPKFTILIPVRMAGYRVRIGDNNGFFDERARKEIQSKQSCKDQDQG